MHRPYKEWERSVQIVSLYELMDEYGIGDLVQLLAGLLTASNLMKFDENPLNAPDAEQAKRVSVVLTGLLTLSRTIALDSSLLALIAKLKEDTAKVPCELPGLTVKVRLDCIIDGIINNLNSKKFMFVPSDQAFYWENPRLFGDEFGDEFPAAAVAEAVEAGNCYAAGRWTACVFHCMRVAEYGLRKIAGSLKVKTTYKGKVHPVEYADWEHVIKAIQANIVDIRKVPRGPKREGLLNAYSSATDHCEYMKDIWRNETSHARRRYSKAESLDAIDRVRGFIQSLPKSKPR